MALDTYSNLQTAIADHLDRDDLTPNIDDFIDIAEARHRRDIRMREMMTRESVTVDARYIDLPTGLLEAITFRLLTDPLTILEEVSPHEMNRQRDNSSGEPKYFTIHEQFEFDVAPDDSYTGDIVFYKALTPLDDDNTSNALLANSPDAYLYGALAASAPFLMHDERIQTWEALYVRAKDSVNKLGRESRRVGPLISRIAGPTP